MEVSIAFSAVPNSGDTIGYRNSKVGHPEREGFPGVQFGETAWVFVVGQEESGRIRPTVKCWHAQNHRTTVSTIEYCLLRLFRGRRHIIISDWPAIN